MSFNAVYLIIKQQVRVVTTKHAQHFFKLADISGKVHIFSDEAEWTSWTQRGDPVLHIELSKWADVFVIAPLDANTLAKIANVNCALMYKKLLFMAIFYRDYVIIC